VTVHRVHQPLTHIRPVTSGEKSALADVEPVKNIAILVLPDFAMLAYAAATDVFRAANNESGARLYNWVNVGPYSGQVRSSSGIALDCTVELASTDQYDYVFVCASDEAVACKDNLVLHWLRRQARGGAIMGAISGGAFVLARAGLLKGYRATLHWIYWDAFGEEFPDIDLRRTLFEIDRDRLTCGGGMAPLDMLRQHIAATHSVGLGDRISELFLHTENRSAQKPQRGSLRDRLGVSHIGLIAAIEAMERSLEEPIGRAELAGIAGVSVRQLDRLFSTQVGLPVNAMYLELRLERALHLVQQSSMPLAEVAYACGFKSPSNFSKAYHDRFGVPPSFDRTRFNKRILS
jgi:transcriptional regulator GlxA family with amidase domain